MDIKTILLIVILVSPIIIVTVAIIGIPRFNPTVQYTKYSIEYIEINSELGRLNPFTLETNKIHEITIKNDMSGIPITKIRFSFSGGMEKFIYLAYGNATIVTLEHNFYELDLREQFNVLKKYGDMLALEIQITSEYYKECTITIQGGVI